MFHYPHVLEKAYEEAYNTHMAGNLKSLHGAVIMSNSGIIYGSGHNQKYFKQTARGSNFSTIHAENAAMGQCETVLKRIAAKVA